MKTYSYVVVGGGLTGGRAAFGIRDQDTTGSIALVTQEPHPPYQRPSLSKAYLRGDKPRSTLYVADATRYDAENIALLTNVRALSVDRATKTVTLDDGQTLGYDKLLLATGGQARQLPIPGHSLGNVFALRTIENADQIREAAGTGKHALVLGGSFIGSEVAASLAMMGTKVTMAFPESRLLERVVPQEMSDWLHQVYADTTITILAGITPDALLGDADVKQVKLSNGTRLDIDLVVMGVGIKLNTKLAKDAGLKTRERDHAVVVNEYLQTNDPDIYAAGDIAAWPDPTFGRQLRVEHWDVAYNQGQVAGHNMAGAGVRYETLPYFFSDLFDFGFEVWGDLSRWNRTVRRGTLNTRKVAYYYFNEGTLVGILAMGRPDEERDPMQALVKAQVCYSSVVEQLGDETVDLAQLVQNATH